MHAHGSAERDTGDVGLLDPDGGEERGDLVGVPLGRVRPGRRVALARPRKIERDAAELLGVGRQLERIAGVVCRRVRDEQQWLALTLNVVVDGEPVYLDPR